MTLPCTCARVTLPCTCAGPDVGWPQHEPNCARVLGYDPEDDDTEKDEA